MWNPSSRLGNHGDHNGFNKAKFMATFSVNGKLKIRDYLIISAMKKEFHQYQQSQFIENGKTIQYADSHDGENILQTNN